MALAGDMMRKAIVFDKATPEVFYCPIDKPTSFEKMYVRARPLEKLCEFDGDGVSGGKAEAMTTLRVKWMICLGVQLCLLGSVAKQISLNKS